MDPTGPTLTHIKTEFQFTPGTNLEVELRKGVTSGKLILTFTLPLEDSDAAYETINVGLVKTGGIRLTLQGTRTVAEGKK